MLVKWLLTLCLSFAFGVLYVQYLTVHPLRMSRCLLAATLAFAAAVASLIFGFQGWALVAAFLAALGTALVGYLLMARRVLGQEDHRPIPEFIRSKGDPGLGHTAVIYFTHGEPETYDPIGWINQFREFDQQGIAFVPLVARPYFLHRLREGYLRVGKSDHRRTHIQMLKSLEQAFRATGDQTTRFYLSFLDDNPRPDAAVIQAVNEGASRIIVSEVFLTISNHTAAGKELVEKLGVEEYGVPIEYSGPLYDSRTLQSMFVHRANQHLGETDKSKVGILLVGHGQPDEWDAEWATETEQEIGFRREILRRFEADGYSTQNLSLAWMHFKEPKPAAKVEEFMKCGVEKVFFFAAAISADAMHSQYDIPALVNKAKIPPGLSLINLGAWNDDSLVIQAIKEKIDAQMEKAASGGATDLPVKTGSHLTGDAA